MTLERLREISRKLRLLEEINASSNPPEIRRKSYRAKPISEDQAGKLENEGWPEDYILFLKEIGSGTGPFSGILSPGDSMGEKEEVWISDQEIEYDSNCSDDEFEKIMLRAGATKNTIIPVCDYGCGERFVLSVDGPRKGSLLYDYGFGDTSIRPLKRSFLDFYESWLNHILEQQGRL